LSKRLSNAISNTTTSEEILDEENEKLGKMDDSKKEIFSNGNDEVSSILKVPDCSSIAEYQEHFERIANSLLNNCILYVNQKPHRFVEIEFYYHGKNHEDPFTHCDERQKKFAIWYFHRSGTGKDSYKGGSYKGMDIAFGNAKVFGGILIRAIQSLEEPVQIIEGPCMCVDYILAQNGVQHITELVKNWNICVLKQDQSPLFIVPSNDLTKKPLFTTPRVGLTLKNTEDQLQRLIFVMKLYRFLAFPESIKKGRQFVVLKMHLEGKTTPEISAIVGGNEDTIQRYVDEFEKGKKMTPEKFIGKTLTTDDFCRMYGTFSK